MSRQLRIYLAAGLAVISGLLTILIYFGSRPGQTTVVVAARAVEPNSLLTTDLLEEMPVDAATAARLRAYAHTDDIAGRLSFRRLEPGEILRTDDPYIAHQLAPTHASEDGAIQRSALLPAGYRAVEVKVEEQGVRPGDFIELYQDGHRVLNREIQVMANDGGRLQLLVLAGAEVEQVVGAQQKGGLRVVIAPVPKGQGAGT